MNEAEDLIRIVEQRGGRLTIEGEKLVIEPQSAALPLIDSLRAHKPQIVALLQSRSEQESAQDSDALGLWLLARCIYRDRCAGGMGGLHLDFARWCTAQGLTIPESRRTFVAALQAAGFAVTTDGLVSGLVLREDVQAVFRTQAAPEASGPPERATAGKRRNAGRRRP
ncbi:MAG: hypothetical protein WB524_24620 [Acidobacteriaceae bacterium]|jgi:hypothetical protein